MINLLIILNIYFVSFLDKPEKTAPQLSPRAVAQRAQWDIPTDAMDYPVSPMYMNELTKMGVKIHHKSRWFNGVTCEMDETTAAKVAELKFVTAVEITRDNTPPSALPQRRAWEAQNPPTSISTTDQLTLYNLLKLHEEGYEGQGILMAICDGGFSNANTLSCFRSKELELGHYDFTDDPYGFYEAGSCGAHGTACLSTITGLTKDYHGAATQAEYVLMRSEEEDTESPKEMDNLVAALEKADSLGVNVFSVSLGYYWFNNKSWDLPFSALDGKTSRASMAATIAARKGMLVCVAAGNEGNKEWQKISIPADADSILAVGAVNTDGVIADFSSHGPTADGRIKPDVCAVGWGTSLINYSEEIYSSNGTSFATPLIAGLAASLWSALPKENAMQIRERIIRSADRYGHPDTNDYLYGYGIPDAWKAYTMKRDEDGLSVAEYGLQEDQPRKVIHGNEILIIRHGHIYNLSGQLIE